MLRVKDGDVRNVARLATASPALMRARSAARDGPVIIDSLTHLFFTIQPETSLTSLGTGTLDDLDNGPEAHESKESNKTAHGGLRAVGCCNSNLGSLEDV